MTISELKAEDWGIGGHTDWLRDYTSALDAVGPVWTALRWQGFLGASATLVGAAMCPTCCAAHSAAGHNAIRVSGPDPKLALEVLGRYGFS